MSKEEAIKKLEEWADSGDIEMAHCEAEDILCDLLIQLGYEDVVQAYHKVHKWYP